MIASELQDILVATLVRKSGGTKQQWRKAIGTVQVHDLATHSHCNWSVHPAGTFRENAAIERLLDTVRLEYPLIAGN